MRLCPICAALLASLACGPTTVGPGDAVTSDASTGTTGSASVGTITASATSVDAGTQTGSSSSSTGRDDTSSSGAGESSGSTTTGDTCDFECGYTTCQCTDGRDNDFDGLVDLDDPECLHPGDVDESSFPFGTIHELDGCRIDCFFDGNSGRGDDGCRFVIDCDPESPGALVGCEYEGNQACDPPPPPSQQCIDFCTPYVLPGCDCFGCCTLPTPDGPRDLWLLSSSECSLANLEACLPCTQQIEACGNPCTPEACEICIADSGPPPGCDTNVCDRGDPCTTDADCPGCEHCKLGCCYPPEP